MRLIRSLLLVTANIFCFVALAQQSSPTSTEARFRPIIQQIERELPTLVDRGAGLFALARVLVRLNV